MKNPESMGADALMHLPPLIEQYPYCSAYRILYTIALANTHSTRLNDELRRTATMMSNSEKLFQLINKGEYEWIRLMIDLKHKRNRKEENTDSFKLIDQYLQRDDTDIDSLLTSTSYSIEDLDDEPDTPANYDEEDDSFDLIDSFLEADNQGQLFVPQAEKTEESLPDSEPSNIREKAFLTESLAKLYVKQHKFEQALAIFSSLNLDNSKKSSYFADQIRFLEKVIAIEAELKATATPPQKNEK